MENILEEVFKYIFGEEIYLIKWEYFFNEF